MRNRPTVFGEALGKKYVEKYFPPEAKARMQEMVRNLLSAMRDDILSRSWMSDDTKEKAMAKIATFQRRSDIPTNGRITATGDSPRCIFRGHDRRSEVRGKRRSRTIGKPVDRGRWGMTPPTSDAEYNPLMN